MKCVCPSGGDRTCPDDCLLAVWHNLPADDKPARRRPIAEQLSKQGYTQEQIAAQLGVSRQTIQLDLANLPIIGNSKRDKTESNPRGAGRPRGRKPPGERAPFDQTVRLHTTPQDWLEFKTQAAEEGISVAEKLGAAVASAAIDPATLSSTAQQKLEMAIRQHKAKLDMQFEQRVRDGIKQRIDEIVLPYWKEQIAEARKLYEKRKGLMDKATFNKIRRGLHPDSRQSISDKVLGEAFDTFMSLEKYLLNEKESPTDIPTVPDNLAEWERMKAEATAERRAKRNSGQQPARR